MKISRIFFILFSKYLLNLYRQINTKNNEKEYFITSYRYARIQ